MAARFGGGAGGVHGFLREPFRLGAGSLHGLLRDLRGALGSGAGGVHSFLREPFGLGAGGLHGLLRDLRGATGHQLGFGLMFDGGGVGLAHEPPQGAPYLLGDVPRRVVVCARLPWR